MASVFERKKPTDKDNYVGIEIEFFAPIEQSDLGKLLTKAKLEKYVELKGDGSITVPIRYRDPADNSSHIQCLVCRHNCGNYSERCCQCLTPFPVSKVNEDNIHWPHELCVLVKQSKLSSILPRVMKVLNEAKAKVNSSCGLHVHLDMRNRKVSQCYSNLVLSQPLLYTLVKKGRRRSSYCRSIDLKRASEFEQMQMQMEDERYRTINALAYDKFTTLEVRLHHGSVDLQEILHWTKLLAKLVHMKPLTKSIHTSKDIRVPKALTDYMKRQVAKMS